MSKNGNESVKLALRFSLLIAKPVAIRMLYLLLISKIRSLVGANPHRFPPFYSNGSDFSHKHISITIELSKLKS